MKNIPCPNGTISKSMKKHRIKFLIIEIILFIILIAYVFSSRAYIENIFWGSVKLNSEKFASDCLTEEFTDKFELHRGDSKNLNAYALKAESYWQNNKYEFDVHLENIQKTPTSYTLSSTNTSSTKENEKLVAAVVYTAEINGIKTLILSYPREKYGKSADVTGIFTAIPLIVKYDLANSGEIKPGEKICRYILDTRGIEMDSENFDIVFSIILFIIALLLGLKLIFQFVNPYKTPTYRQLEEYGDVDTIIADIEYQLGNNPKKDGKKIICEDWILCEDTFSLKIIKNHTRHEKMDYYKKTK